MKRHIHTLAKHLATGIVSIMAVALLAACGDDKDFVVEGCIEGTSAQSITLTYYSGGGLKSITQSGASGTFRLKGESANPTLAILTVAPENTRLATLLVSNGDRISIEADLANPLLTKVKGNGDSKKIADWIAKNRAIIESGHAAEINAAVSAYVSSNPKSLTSAAILATYFMADGYAAQADSLVKSLDRSMRTNELMQGFSTVVATFKGLETNDVVPFLTLYSINDSMVNINPMRHSATLLCFLDEDRAARDSVVPHLHALADSTPFRRFAAVEISTAPDSSSWRASVGRDSVAWARTWVQGSVAAAPIRRMAVRRIPFFIVADSTGAPIYRGPSITAARRAVETHLDKQK